MTDKRYRADIEAFGKRLRDLREQKEMSQLDLEVESGINRTEISRIETGKKNIELITLFKLAGALKVSPAEFFQ
ncbi:MAG TPA: helix-turn-helix transcriptional regulator [Chitinophagaceae bacterium]|jgi:transcriptional regulator with XRE-family HTH domain|nr:helix-turn-helix transcriptional regulator [Chitinophagaceae bacterium]